VFGANEASLTPLMEEIEARFDGVKVFSLPSVDHPERGCTSSWASRAAQAAAAAFEHLQQAGGARGSAHPARGMIPKRCILTTTLVTNIPKRG
jgi:molybdopterin-biosynthesis enzyme MoeA-like protein